MPDMEKVISDIEQQIRWIEEIECHKFPGWLNVTNAMRDALALLKEQEEQKWKWLQTIADTQLAISPTGYESEDEMAKREWEWNGLQIAWEIIAGEERSEHPRLVRCKDCKHILPKGFCHKHSRKVTDDWFCADGEREKGR